MDKFLIGNMVTLSSDIEYEIPIFDSYDFIQKSKIAIFNKGDVGLILDKNKHWLKLLTSAGSCGWSYYESYGLVSN